MRKSLMALFTGVALVGSAPTFGAGAGVALATEAEPEVAAVAPFVDHSDYDTLLQKYVSPYGVRYAAWHASEEDRDAAYSMLNARLMEIAPTIYAYDRQSVFAASTRVSARIISISLSALSSSGRSSQVPTMRPTGVWGPKSRRAVTKTASSTSARLVRWARAASAARAL